MSSANMHVKGPAAKDVVITELAADSALAGITAHSNATVGKLVARNRYQKALKEAKQREAAYKSTSSADDSDADDNDRQSSGDEHTSNTLTQYQRRVRLRKLRQEAEKHGAVPRVDKGQQQTKSPNKRKDRVDVTEKANPLSGVLASSELSSAPALAVAHKVAETKEKENIAAVSASIESQDEEEHADVDWEDAAGDDDDVFDEGQWHAVLAREHGLEEEPAAEQDTSMDLETSVESNVDLEASPSPSSSPAEDSDIDDSGGMTINLGDAETMSAGKGQKSEKAAEGSKREAKKKKKPLLSVQAMRNCRSVYTLAMTARGSMASQLADEPEIAARMLSLIPERFRHMAFLAALPTSKSFKSSNRNSKNTSSSSSSSSLSTAPFTPSKASELKELLVWFTSTFRCDKRDADLLVHCAKRQQSWQSRASRTIQCALEQLIYAIDHRVANGQAYVILFTAACRALNLPTRIVHALPQFIKLQEEDLIQRGQKKPGRVQEQLLKTLKNPPTCFCEKPRATKVDGTVTVVQNDEDDVITLNLEDLKYSPAQKPKPSKPHALDYILDQLRSHPMYYQKKMFGLEGVVIDTNLVLVATAKDEPWNGLLVPTERALHASLQADLPQLQPHAKLGKWLYVSKTHADFEEVASSLIDMILKGDKRIGVESTATQDRVLVQRLKDKRERERESKIERPTMVISDDDVIEDNASKQRKSKAEASQFVDDDDIVASSSSTAKSRGRQQRSNKVKDDDVVGSRSAPRSFFKRKRNAKSKAASAADEQSDESDADSDIIDVTPAKNDKKAAAAHRAKEIKTEANERKQKEKAELEEKKKLKALTVDQAPPAKRQRTARVAAKKGSAVTKALAASAAAASDVEGDDDIKEAAASDSEIELITAKAQSESDADDDTACEKCRDGNSTSRNAIVYCDGCNLGWHQRCIDPPLKKVPEGDWYCSKCIDDSEDDDDDDKAVDNSIAPHGKAASKRKASSSSSKSSRAADGMCCWWVEVYCSDEQKWSSIDLARVLFDKPDSFECDAPMKLTYCVAFRPAIGQASKRRTIILDVTRRYAKAWQKTDKLRGDETWWLSALRRMSVTVEPFMRSAEEADAKRLKQLLEKETLPKSLTDVKNHPLFAIEAHLHKFQIIYPSDKEHIRGYITTKNGEKHAIYPRENVKMLHTADRWIREGRQVKWGEESIKSVNAMKHVAARREDPTTQLFGYWQTEAWHPRAAVNGRVPRGDHGNVDLWTSAHLPPGTAHINKPRLPGVCKKLGIDFAPAMTGFDIAKGRSVPRIEGVVVCKENEKQVIEAWNEAEARARERAEQRRLDAVLTSWKKVMRAIMIRTRVMSDLTSKGFDKDAAAATYRQQHKAEHEAEERAKQEKKQKVSTKRKSGKGGVKVEEEEQEEEEVDLLDEAPTANVQSHLEFADEHVHAYTKSVMDSTNSWTFECACGKRRDE